jgi:hypothetical protein
MWEASLFGNLKFFFRAARAGGPGLRAARAGGPGVARFRDGRWKLGSRRGA